MLKLLPYLLRSARRSSLRSSLTVLGVAIAVFIVTVLGALLESRAAAVKATSSSILVTAQKDNW